MPPLTSSSLVQGWACERVLLSYAFQGRLLMVLPSDPASHVKKVGTAPAGGRRTAAMARSWGRRTCHMHSSVLMDMRMPLRVHACLGLLASILWLLHRPPAVRGGLCQPQAETGVLPSLWASPLPALTQVQEVAALVERLHSLTPGWLLAGEQWKVRLSAL